MAGHLTYHSANLIFLVWIKTIGGLIHDEIFRVMEDTLGKTYPLVKPLGKCVYGLETDLFEETAFKDFFYTPCL